MSRPSAEEVAEQYLDDLRKAIAPEVNAQVKRQMRRLLLENRVLYGFVVLLVIGAAFAGQRQVEFNRTTIAQLCTVATIQRHVLEQQATNTDAYLKSKPGQERNGLNDYIRTFVVPQLAARLKTEKVPPACRADELRASR